MKYLIAIISLCLMLVNYSQKTDSKAVAKAIPKLAFLEVPNTVVEKDMLTYQNHSSTWTFENAAYSGYVESYFSDGSLQQRFGVLNGLKQGEAKDWFEDGKLNYLANYYQGRLHGEKKVWYSDETHHVATHLNYHLGKLHGLQQKWYPTGEIYKRLNINMGKEEGLQQAFRKNGALYVNYEAKEGRIFGLKRASLCFELEDENLVYGKK